jgi:hypothetical protein
MAALTADFFADFLAAFFAGAFRVAIVFLPRKE